MKQNVTLNRNDLSVAISEYLAKKRLRVVGELKFNTHIQSTDYYDKPVEPFATFQDVTVDVETSAPLGLSSSMPFGYANDL